jgi:hypothetical protein
VVPSRHRWLAGLLAAGPGDRVIDLGCGTGASLVQAAPAVPGGLLAGGRPERGRPGPDRRGARGGGRRPGPASRRAVPPGRPEGAAAPDRRRLRPSGLPQRARVPPRPGPPGRRGGQGAGPGRPAGAGPQRLRHADLRLRGPGADPPASSLLAFVACPPELKRLLKVTAPPYLYSGPSPVASLASVLLGLQVNQARGDELRALLWQRTRRILDHLDKLGGVHPEPLRLPDRRGAPGRPRRPGQGRACPARRSASASR